MTVMLAPVCVCITFSAVAAKAINDDKNQTSSEKEYDLFDNVPNLLLPTVLFSLLYMLLMAFLVIFSLLICVLWCQKLNKCKSRKDHECQIWMSDLPPSYDEAINCAPPPTYEEL